MSSNAIGITTQSMEHLHKARISVSRTFITIALPIILTLISVRVVMTPAFIKFEYNRPGFPEDVYGFTREERLHYAPLALDYLLTGAGIDYLGDLTFNDGYPLFNERELRHMVDVKVVVRAAFTGLMVLFLGLVAVGYSLWRGEQTRVEFWQGLFNGAVLTISIIIFIIVFALTAWDAFFTSFHTLFFEQDTWRFAYSDMLIRLFPEQFWFDAALTIGTLTALGAVGILLVAWKRRIA